MENGAWIPTIDVSPASQLGELKVLLPSGFNYPTADEVVPQLKNALRDFDPDNDYLLSVGDPLVIAAASALIAYEHDYFRLLKWDRQQRRYIPIMVKLYGG
jgi:hypothetical protein